MAAPWKFACSSPPAAPTAPTTNTDQAPPRLAPGRVFPAARAEPGAGHWSPFGRVDLPFAAAMGTGSVVIMVVYLLAVSRTGALENL